MRFIHFAGAAVAAALLAGPASAGTLFALNNGNNSLYTIDTNTLNVSLVGALGTDIDFAGAAYDGSSGTLYMIGGRNNDNLYTVNTTTGAATLVGAHGVNDLFGLEFDSSTGTLYGTQFSGGTGFYSLNTTTGAANLIANMAHGIGGLSYNSATNKLVGIEDGAGAFYEINRATGAQTFLGGDGFVDDSGLAYDADLNVYWDLDYQGNLRRYNATTFERTTVLSGLGTYDGLAYANGGGGAVPEPATWALMIGGFGIAGGSIRRRGRLAA